MEEGGGCWPVGGRALNTRDRISHISCVAAGEDPSDTAGGGEKKRQLLIVPVNLNTQHLGSKTGTGAASQAACRGFRCSTAGRYAAAAAAPARCCAVALYPLLMARRWRTSGPCELACRECGDPSPAVAPEEGAQSRSSGRLL